MLKAGQIVLYRGNGSELYPADEESETRLRKLKECEWYTFTFKRCRNYRFLRKYFKLLDTCFKNQEEFQEKEWFRQHTLLSIGWCETHIMKDGTVLAKAKSISFDNCKESEFEEVYQKTLTFLIGRYGFDNDFVDELLRYS